MAQFDYSRMQGTASRLMTRFKQGTVTLSRLVDTETPVDADAPWLGFTKTTTVYTLAATVAAVSGDQANAKFIDGTVITAADLVVTCAVPAITPAMSDKLAIDGVVRTIKKIVQVPAAGTAVAYKLFIAG